jgi:GAF domain-containing protein
LIAPHAWHQFSTSLIAAGDPTTVLEQMLDAAIDVQSADFGNVELFDAELVGLVIIAQRNFQPAFLNHFALVRGEDCARGSAAEAPSRVSIEDIDTDKASRPSVVSLPRRGFARCSRHR